MKKHYPLLVLFLTLAVTFSLWVMAKGSDAFINTSFLVLASQLLSLFGLVLISLSFVLSTRARFLESFLGGLDKLYSAHKIIGSLAFGFVMLHPVLLYTNSLPDLAFAATYILPSNSLAYNLGIYGLYVMIFSFIFIVFVRLPYNTWKISHRLLGLSFILGSVHALIIGSDIASFLPLKLWVFAFISVGLFSFFYIVFLYARFGPKHEFSVERVERKLDVLTFYLKIGRQFLYKPGQFVYLAFKNREISGELHPFSLSSSPFDNLLRVSIKVVGDFTLALGSVLKGDKGVIYGPYGSFAQGYNEGRVRTSVWVGGGIGVTPFLGMLRNEFIKKSGKQIYFYYCVRREDEAVYHDEIASLVGKLKNVRYVLWCSENHNRLTAAELMREISNNNDTLFQLCGPKPMMASLNSQLTDLGINAGNIRFEDFDLL